MDKERRAHERVPVVMLGVTFRSINISEPLQILGYIKNISLGGMCVETREDIKTESILRLDFVLPDGKEFSDIIGKIVWVKRSENVNLAGVTFIKMGLFQRIKLFNSIKKILKVKSD